MAYSKKLIDHYENPRNVGSMDKESKEVGTGLVGAPACGDVMKLQIKVNDSGVIEDAKFKTFGCGSAIASSSLITEWVKGKKIDQASEIKNTEIANHLALPPVKIHCSVLAEDAIKAAIADYKDKNKNANSFLNELGNPYKKIIFDKEGIYAIEWGAYGVPETFIIYNNMIIEKYIGPLNEQSLDEIKNLIK